jgi:hypothetical protein
LKEYLAAPVYIPTGFDFIENNVTGTPNATLADHLLVAS